MTVEITPPPRAAVALGRTLASPTFDHEDEIKLEQLGYKQVSETGQRSCPARERRQWPKLVGLLCGGRRSSLSLQELRRGMGLLGSIGLCTGIIQPLLSAGERPYLVRGGVSCGVKQKRPAVFQSLPPPLFLFDLSFLPSLGVVSIGFSQGGPVTGVEREKPTLPHAGGCAARSAPLRSLHRTAVC